MARDAHRRIGLVVAILMVGGLLLGLRAPRAGAITIDEFDSTSTAGTVQVTDTPSAPGMTCTYDLRTGTLSVSVRRPSTIGRDYNGKRSKPETKITIQTLIGEDFGGYIYGESGDKTETFTFPAGQSSFQLGGTTRFSDAAWGPRDGKLNQSSIGPIRASVKIDWKWVSAYGTVWDWLTYRIDNYRTVVYDAAGNRTSSVGSSCVPPYQPRVVLPTVTPATGAAVDVLLTGFPARTRVTMRYQVLMVESIWGPYGVTYKTTMDYSTGLLDVTTNKHGRYAGTIKVPVPRVKFDPRANFNWYQRLSTRVVGKFEEHTRFAPREVLARDPRSGVRGSSVTLTMVGCISDFTGAPVKSGVVQWQRGADWVQVARISIGANFRGSKTITVPSWAPIGTNTLRFYCQNTSVLWETTFTVVAPTRSVQAAEETSTPTPAPAVAPTPAATETAPEPTISVETPTAEPTLEPTPEPTLEPTPDVSPEPTVAPEPTSEPTLDATGEPAPSLESDDVPPTEEAPGA